MNIKIVSKAIGAILWCIGIIIFLLPAVFAVFAKEFGHILPFLYAAVTAIVLGTLLNIGRIDEQELDNVKKMDALAIVFFSWAAFGLICAIPYLFFGLSPINALFEAFSGVTSTGSTILTDFSLYPKTFFFFRSMTQWLGGLGIIVLFVAILPRFAIAGRQIFFAELPGPTDEKFTPRIRHTATWLWTIYVGLTVLQILALKFIGGMDFFHAICNSFSTVSSGGFSPLQSSTTGYNSIVVNWIIIFFMLLSGTSFILLYRVFIQGKLEYIFKSQEFKVYLGANLLLGLVIAAMLIIKGDSPNWYNALTDGIYQVLSMTTSTGSNSANYALWHKDTKVFLFIAMFLGGCAASTSGGIKVARWILVFKYMKREIAKIVHPKGIYLIKYEQKVIADDAMAQVVAFVFFFFTICAVSIFTIGLIEKNSIVAITGAITSLGNIGPGFGSIIGPAGSFDSLQSASKAILIFNMLIGRLELIPFLAFLHPDMWRKY